MESSGAIPVMKEISIQLSDDGVSVDNEPASEDPESAVYVGAPIVYYEAGHDESYGEGTAEDEHTAEEADAHTVITITQPGTYRVSGRISTGQIAVDLGEDAKDDPNAIVNLILDGADITCTVAPAIIFYNVYECEEEDSSATWEVNTADAGANLILEDDSENTVRGSYVARIYEEGTTDKLHKYDGAVYSKMSMNVSGRSSGTGRLSITADNEGLDSELHLTINSGIISITSQNDGINTNEDNISVTTINGGNVTINAGLGAEGDGIDSNGYLVLNGGTVFAIANGRSGDSGLDSSSGTYLNGGTVFALGSRNDPIAEDSRQAYLDFTFNGVQEAESVISIADDTGIELMNYTSGREYASLVYSAPEMDDSISYTVSVDGVQMENSPGGGPGGNPPGGGPPETPDGDTPPPDGSAPPEGDNSRQGGGRGAPPDASAPSGESPPEPPGENSEPPPAESSE